MLHLYMYSYRRNKSKIQRDYVECTSEIGGKEHEENANIVETNIEIKAEEEIPAGIKFGQEVVGDDDVSKEESTSACGKDRFEFTEGTDEVTGYKEIEQANTEIAVYENIASWPQTCSE